MLQQAAGGPQGEGRRADHGGGRGGAEVSEEETGVMGVSLFSSARPFPSCLAVADRARGKVSVSTTADKGRSMPRKKTAVTAVSGGMSPPFVYDGCSRACKLRRPYFTSSRTPP